MTLAKGMLATDAVPPYPQQGRTKSKNRCTQISNGNRETGPGDDEAAKSTQTSRFDASL